MKKPKVFHKGLIKEKLSEIGKHNSKSDTWTFSSKKLKEVVDCILKHETSGETSSEDEPNFKQVKKKSDTIYIIHDTWEEKMIGVYDNIELVFSMVEEFVIRENRSLIDHGVVIYRSKMNKIGDYLKDNDIVDFDIISEE